MNLCACLHLLQMLYSPGDLEGHKSDKDGKYYVLDFRYILLLVVLFYKIGLIFITVVLFHQKLFPKCM